MNSCLEYCCCVNRRLRRGSAIENNVSATGSVPLRTSRSIFVCVSCGIHVSVTSISTMFMCLSKAFRYPVHIPRMLFTRRITTTTRFRSMKHRRSTTNGPSMYVSGRKKHSMSRRTLATGCKRESTSWCQNPHLRVDQTASGRDVASLYSLHCSARAPQSSSWRARQPFGNAGRTLEATLDEPIQFVCSFGQKLFIALPANLRDGGIFGYYRADESATAKATALLCVALAKDRTLEIESRVRSRCFVVSRMA